jgi:hypothetical protein
LNHLISERYRLSPAAFLTGGNRTDITQLTPLIDQIPPVRGKRGRPRADAPHTGHGHASGAAGASHS